ncbi:MAG TPA: nitroreductase family protein [Candidatus Limnocylindria bacterium]|nr:nitroreductase family protein [Candidatus Limnocylindria bacterium]
MGDGREMTRVMRRLRAIREYADEPVSDDDLDEILTVARWTGSAQNQQPWRFVVVRERESLRRLGQLTPNAPQVGRAQLAIAVVMPGQKSVLEAYDEGRVTERILLAAAALGLGAAVGWVPQDARESAAALLRIPKGRLLRSVVAIGHPSPVAERRRAAPGTARLPLEALVHHERWRA